MTLPAFLSRVHDAAGPLLGGLGESELGERLESTSLVLEIAEPAASDPGHRAAYTLAANLAARLYPHIGLDAPEGLLDDARTLVQAINPRCRLGPPRQGNRLLTLSWAGGEPAADRVTVAADKTNIFVDGSEPASAAFAPAAMLAAALGVGELFRALFSDRLADGREGPATWGLNLISLGEPRETPEIPRQVDLGEVHLAGCGAVGQAAVATLRELSLAGRLIAVDFDPLDEGNLQRYLLAAAADVGSSKPALVERALRDSGLAVEAVPTRWGADPRSAPGRQTVLSAFDTKQARIELQSGLHRQVFNAWTQPRDLGVSRHLDFGESACLACLGWPRQARPSESEMIATSLGEHELRVALHLIGEHPIGQPLPAEAIQPSGRLALPDDAQSWSARTLLDDLIERFELPREVFAPFAAAQVGELYRDAVCGSLLIEHSGTEREVDLSVPLAHQSAIAGILLATWLFVDRVPALRELLPEATQARYDVLRGGEQHWPRPRPVEPRCICQDAEFQAAYAARWTDA